MGKIYELPLDKLKMGEEGTIASLLGGCKLKNKLDAMGLRCGKKVTKISNVMLNGPVTVKIDNSSKIAIGRGMAKKIIVRVHRDG